MTTPNEQMIASMARKEQALRVGRPPGTSPGWTVWHIPSGKQAIQAVRYKKDAEDARVELLMTIVDWTRAKPVMLHNTPERRAFEVVYRKYGLLRQQQLANNRFWDRPQAKREATA
jgi:hypothetical protein